MRTMSAPLITLLNTGNQFCMADLYTVKLSNGTILRYTSAQNNITFSGNTYLSSGLLFSRKNVKWVVGIEVDTLQLDIIADSSTLVNGLPLITTALQGQFDGAIVVVDRLFLSDWNTPVDKVGLFYGKVSNFSAERNTVMLTVKSILEMLTVQMPPNLYQASCVHTLYSPGCKVNKASYTTTGTSTGMNSDGSIKTALAQASGYFNMGAIKITSGANNGLTRTVKTHSGTDIYVTNPFPNPIVSGTTFSISPGCDKLRTGNCTNKFSNTANFKAFEFIPVPETAA